MVWHDDPGKEVVANMIELQQRVLNHCCNAMVLQKTVSVSHIKVFFNLSLQYDSFFFPVEVTELSLPAFYDC